MYADPTTDTEYDMYIGDIGHERSKATGDHNNNIKRTAKEEEEEEDLFEKIQRCCTLYDFRESRSDLASKQQKRRTLHKLVVELASERQLPEEGYAKLVEMISLNVFRPNPFQDQRSGPAGLATLTEPTWEHLKWVYEIFLVLLTSRNFHKTIAKNSIDRNFILHLLNLMDSGDERERKYLLRVIYQIYKIFVKYRSVIRQETINTLLKYIYETGSLNGVEEVMDLLGVIIHGLSVPVKKKHRVLVRLLLPLHRMDSLSVFHKSLTYCVLEMIRKDPRLSLYFIRGLINVWPKSNAMNEVIFILELQQILALTPPDQFSEVRRTLFDQLARSSCSLHFNVAETALAIWEDNSVLQLVEENLQYILPVVFPHLCRVIEEHWNKKIVGDAQRALNTFKKMDRSLLHGIIRTTSFEQRRRDKRRQLEEDMLRRFASLDNLLLKLCS